MGRALLPPASGVAAVDRRTALGGPLSVQHGGAVPAVTALPDSLRTGLETLSGESLADVRVHRNSAEPARLSALAFTRGSSIHVAPGQDRHVPHEAWHVVQQKQRRVGTTRRLGGVAINDSPRLEAEADVFGRRAEALGRISSEPPSPFAPPAARPSDTGVVQRRVYVGPAAGATRLTQQTRGHPVDGWITDATRRHFVDQQELTDFAQGATETIGSVTGSPRAVDNGTWVRLDPARTLVLGENHTRTTMTQIVRATGTRRFKYEGYNELPAGAAHEFQSTTQANVAATGDLQNEMGMPAADVTDHGLEHMFAKVVYPLGLTKRLIHDPPGWPARAGNGRAPYALGERMAFYLGFGLRIAQDLHNRPVPLAPLAGSGLALAQAWAADTPLFAAILTEIDNEDHIGTILQAHAADVGVLEAMITVMVDFLRDRYVADEAPTVAETAQIDAVQGQFHAPAPVYNQLRQGANAWREQYILRKVNEALAGNFLLVGMGDRHRRNLTPALDALALDHAFMDTYLADGRATMQQVVNNSHAEPAPAPPPRSGCNCYLTTACVTARGLPDDCEELRVLRVFRDSYLAALPNGPALIERYYKVSPAIVAAIDRRPDRLEVYDNLYEVIRSCVDAILVGDDHVAYGAYRTMVDHLGRSLGLPT